MDQTDNENGGSSNTNAPRVGNKEEGIEGAPASLLPPGSTIAVWFSINGGPEMGQGCILKNPAHYEITINALVSGLSGSLKHHVGIPGWVIE